jgi:hypothetical protein
MGRRTDMRWLLAAGLFCLAGCATPGSRGLLNFKGLADREDSIAASDSKRNPFKDETAEPGGKSKLSDARDSTSRGGASGPPGQATTRSRANEGDLDPELKKLIEEELRHEPPAERQRLFNQWKKFDPAFIRELVETHRLSRQVAAARKGDSIELASADSGGSVRDQADADATQPATGEAAGKRRLATPDTLGTADPWSDLPGSSAGKAARSPAGAPSGDDVFDAPGQDPRSGRDVKNGRNLVISPRSTDPKTAGKGTGSNTDDVFSAVGVSDASRSGAGANTARPSQQAAGASRGATLTGALSAGSDPFSESQVKPAASKKSGPVELGPPTDIPSGAAPSSSSEVATATAKAAPQAAGTAAGGPSASGSGSGGNSPGSGLAGLGGRLLGVINPRENASRNAPSPGWRDDLQRVLASATSDASQTSVGTTDAERLAYTEKQVHLRMMQIVAGQPAKSLEPIPGLDAADQEFWQQMFWAVSNYFDAQAIADSSDRATQTVTQLRSAVQRLQERSKLELRNVAFCHKIVNYGNYERFKRDEFTPGQPVLLYAEVGNFKSEPSADGPYRTILKSTIEIYDSRGTLVQSMPFPPTEDICANPRRDYYNSYEFVIPQRIGLGPHTLKLTVEDQLSQKVATSSVNFTVK